jgi:hypothetical protein
MRQQIKFIWGQIPAYVRWLLSPRLFWFAVVVIGGVLIFGFWQPITSRRLGQAGAILQLLGTAMGFASLVSTRSLFERPSFLQEIRNWINRRPRRHRTILGSGAMFSLSDTVSATGMLWQDMGATLLDKRVEALIANVEELHKQASAWNVRHQAAIAEVQKDLAKKTKDLEDRTANVSLKLSESQTGSLWKAVCALWMIFVGTALAGIAPFFG